jgi:hypothetical protein
MQWFITFKGTLPTASPQIAHNFLPTASGASLFVIRELRLSRSGCGAGDDRLIHPNVSVVCGVPKLAANAHVHNGLSVLTISSPSLARHTQDSSIVLGTLASRTCRNGTFPQ